MSLCILTRSLPPSRLVSQTNHIADLNACDLAGSDRRLRHQHWLGSERSYETVHGAVRSTDWRLSGGPPQGERLVSDASQTRLRLDSAAGHTECRSRNGFGEGQYRLNRSERGRGVRRRCRPDINEEWLHLSRAAGRRQAVSRAETTRPAARRHRPFAMLKECQPHQAFVWLPNPFRKVSRMNGGWSGQSARWNAHLARLVTRFC